MKITKVLFRSGICIMIIGLSILLANLTSLHGSTSSQRFEVPANDMSMLVTELHNRPYEIRILVPEDFNGRICIFNYEGIKKLIDGTKTPILEQTLQGSLLIDFTPSRRGTYLFLIESKVAETISGSIGLVEKEAISQDVLVDSTIILLSGVAIVFISTWSKYVHYIDPKHKTKNVRQQKIKIS